jgi:hypothetical protein
MRLVAFGMQMLIDCSVGVLGGWSHLSSEGRYMGAAAFGNQSRTTNPYYKRLREIIHFGADGALHLNTALANWAFDVCTPYSADLIDILGEPILHHQVWRNGHRWATSCERRALHRRSYFARALQWNV